MHNLSMPILRENIELKLKSSPEEVKLFFENVVSTHFIILISNKLLYGKIDGYKISAISNPPVGISDPFRSRIIGLIDNQNNQTTLKLSIKPSYVLIVFLWIWNAIMFLMILDIDLPTLQDKFSFIIIYIIWILFPLGLTRLKVNWDRRRIEKFIRKHLK